MMLEIKTTVYTYQCRGTVLRQMPQLIIVNYSTQSMGSVFTKILLQFQSLQAQSGVTISLIFLLSMHPNQIHQRGLLMPRPITVPPRTPTLSCFLMMTCCLLVFPASLFDWFKPYCCARQMTEKKKITINHTVKSREPGFGMNNQENAPKIHLKISKYI